MRRRRKKKITVEWRAAMLACKRWSSPGVKGAGAALGQGLFLGLPDLRFLIFDANPSSVTGAREKWVVEATVEVSLCLESLLGPNLVQKAVGMRVCTNHSHGIY
jgi:hypothetical protein